MLDRIKLFLEKYDLQDKTVIVGFSGGFDSMCLLDILYRLKQKDEFLDLKVISAHFNHNWRGEESLKEQEVCRLFAMSKGFEFYTKTASIDIKKTENDARIARYDFFEEACDYFDADAVFTAHNKDDNAETVLYRVIKGTGLVGLRGIAEKRNNFYRPLLKISRAEILDYCNKYNLSPNNDSSNYDTKYRRNYIRLNVIPSIEKVNKQVKDSLNTLAEVANSENAIIEEYLATMREKVLDSDKISVSEFKKLSEPVKMRFLHEYINSLDLDYDYKKIRELYDFIKSNYNKKNGTTISLTTASWLYVDDKIIERIPHKSSRENKKFGDFIIDSEGEYSIGNLRFIIKPYIEDEVFIFPESTAKFAYVNLSKIKFPLTLRCRKEGDMINPLGMSGTMKLKKYMNSKGISRHVRDEILLLANDEEVLWVVGVGLSNKIAVVNKPTHVIEVL